MLTFIVIAISMVLSLIVMMITIKEKNAYGYQKILEIEQKEGATIKREEGPFQGLIECFKHIVRSKDKSAVALLLGIFLWFCGYYALCLFSVYATEVLGLERGPAGGMLLFISLTFLIMIIPSGIIGTKIGRRLTIKIGLIIFSVGMILGFLIQTTTVIIIGFIIAGIGFSFVNIHAVVVLWELLPSEKRTGTYTGIYFLAIFLGAIFGPVIVGSIIDILGSFTLLLIIAIFFLLGLVCMFFVKKGEAEPLS